MFYMKKILFVLFLAIATFTIEAQQRTLRKVPGERNRSGGNLFQNDTTSFRGEVTINLDGETKYTDYKIISINNDTTVVDTTLVLKKDFIFNYLRKDNFELLPFHNQGQTFNNLAYNFENNSLLPTIGVTAKHFNYYKVKDVYYYEVPTPTSEVLFRTGLEQGQVLNAFLTMNTSRQFNFSIAYKGLRSLGKYRYSLASHGNFITTFNYHTKNKKYFARGHFSSFDLLNNQNGGLTPESIDFFENNDPNYIDRARLEVNLTDAENFLEGKRYYFEQQITLFSKKNKIEKHNSALSKNIKKYNAIISKINFLKNDSISSDKKLKSKTSLKGEKSTNKNPVKNKAITNKTDSITADKIVNVDSLTTKTLSNIKNVFVENDSITPKNSIKIDSLTLKQLSSKQDTIIKSDSVIAAEKLKKIDSLVIAAAEIKIDSSLFITLDKKSNLDLKFGHTFMYETKHYRFKQESENPIFGDAFKSNISDHTSYQKLDNQFYLQFHSPYTGTLKAKINYYKYNYHYNSILFYESQTIPDRYKGNAIAVGADWKVQFKNIYLNADANSIIDGDITGSSIKASAMFKRDSVFSFKGFAELTSKTSNLNKILYQSGYLTYNWQNNFKNEKISVIGIKFKSANWGNLTATYNVVDDYTYFDEFSKPIQATETLNYIKVKANKAISFRKFTLDNTVMYQKLEKGASFFRVPEIVTRNSLYFSSHVFKGKSMYLQTGVTFKYFTSFSANAYNPLLGEFVLQNDTEIGGYPILDYFINAQIRRTRIFLKVENFGASFTGRTYYSAPNYPYRDLTVRFGVVWNWFI